VSVLLDIHSVEISELDYPVMRCHHGRMGTLKYRPLFAVSTVALCSSEKVLDSLVIRGVFKKLCQNACDMLV
jgi:hypothetical protein